LKRRFVATIEWLRLWPNDGFFPQIAQTLDTAAECSYSKAALALPLSAPAGIAGARVYNDRSAQERSAPVV